MVNPALEFAKIFEGWKAEAKGGPVVARRNYARSLGIPVSTVTRMGMKNLVDIGARIEEMKSRGSDVEPFEYGLPRWQTSFVLALADKRTAIPDEERATWPIPVEQLHGIKSFGLLLEAHAAALQPRPEFVDRIEGALEEAEEFVRTVDVSVEHRHYLLGLLARIRAALHEGRPGNMRDATNEFVGATVVAESAAPEEQKGKWAAVRNNIVEQALGGAAGNLIAQGLGVAAIYIAGTIS